MAYIRSIPHLLAMANWGGFLTYYHQEKIARAARRTAWAPRGERLKRVNGPDGGFYL
jgi:hypothetical protein